MSEPLQSLEEAYARYRTQKQFGALDALRCLAIVAVVWHHSGPQIESIPLSVRGFLGVDLFFVVSGYLIVTLLLREKSVAGSFSIKNFYVRRTLRIFPLYYGMIAVLFCYYALVNTSSVPGENFIDNIWIYLTYTGNFFFLGWGVVWSLAAEEQFYIVWPQVERFDSGTVVLFILILIFFNQFFNFPSSRAVIGEWIGIEGFTELTIVHVTFTPILLGVLLAHLLHHPQTFRYLAQFLHHPFASMFWLLCLVLLLCLPNDDLSGVHRLLLHLVMCLLIGSCIIREDHKLMPILRFPVFVRIGIVSYGIYIFHIQVIIVAERILAKIGVHSEIALFVFGLLLSTVVAELSFRFFERKFLALKGRFSAPTKN